MPAHPSESVRTSDELALANHASSARVARDFVQDVISCWGATPVRDPGLPTSEVITNAVVHTDGEITIRVRHLGRHVRVEVHDVEPAPPRLREPDRGRPGGWGMQFVDSLAACWGVTDIEDDGKVVWFDIELTPASSLATDR